MGSHPGSSGAPGARGSSTAMAGFNCLQCSHLGGVSKDCLSQINVSACLVLMEMGPAHSQWPHSLGLSP